MYNKNGHKYVDCYSLSNETGFVRQDGNTSYNPPSTQSSYLLFWGSNNTQSTFIHINSLPSNVSSNKVCYSAGYRNSQPDYDTYEGVFNEHTAGSVVTVGNYPVFTIRNNGSEDIVINEVDFYVYSGSSISEDNCWLMAIFHFDDVTLEPSGTFSFSPLHT